MSFFVVLDLFAINHLCSSQNKVFINVSSYELTPLLDLHLNGGFALVFIQLGHDKMGFSRVGWNIKERRG